MQGAYGPILPNREVEVPLWMAMALHKRKRCRILPPDWMDIEALKCDALSYHSTAVNHSSGGEMYAVCLSLMEQWCHQRCSRMLLQHYLASGD